MDFTFSKGRPIFQSNHRSHRHHHHSQSGHSSSPSRQPLLLSASPVASRSSPRTSPPPTLEPIKTSGVILSCTSPGGTSGVTGNGIVGNGPNGVNGLTLNGSPPVRGEPGNIVNTNGGNGLNCADSYSLLMNQAARFVRKVNVFKEPDDAPDLGLTLCGGAEVGLFGAIYVSRVAEDSLAEKAGLIPGDQILSANYISFLDSYMTCQKALHIICSHDIITFNIFPRAEALSFQRRHATYNWVDPEGRPVSPPPPDRDLLTSVDPEFDPLLIEPSSTSPSKINTSPRRRLSIRPSEQLIRTVQIVIEKGINPGLMIRGGLEYGLGIYVTGIESPSAAERGGLKIGDQILYVNNHDFQHVLHDEAVDILRSSPRLTMKVRYVGKIPASNVSLLFSSSSSSSAAAQLTSSEGSSGSSNSQTEFPFNRIPSSRCSLPETSHHHRLNRSPCGSQRTSSPGTGSPGYRPISEQGTNHVTPTLLVTESAEEEILEEKLNQLLPERDRITFAYYRNEYETKGMTVDAFIALFLELLDTREKYSLLNHFRIIIREEDLDKFDELIFKREEQAMIKSKANPIESAHMIAGDDEESSETSISFAQESSTSMVNEHHHHHHHHQQQQQQPNYHPNDHHSYHHSPNDSTHTKSAKLNSIERSSSRNGNVSVRFRPEMDSLSPLSFTKDQPIPRRHSSCNPEVKSTSNCNDFLGVPVNLDERRWSIAAAHDLPNKYNTQKDSVYDYHENALRKHSLSGVEMKTINSSDNRDNNNSHLSLHGQNNLYRNDEKSHDNELIVGVEDEVLTNHHHQHLHHYHSHPHAHSSSANYSAFQSRVRRHSSLPGPGSFNTFGQSTSSVSPFNYQPHRSSSFRIPYHRSVREPDGRLRVIVKKSKPILGLAIEGGCDVPSQPQPRIISIHSSGAAFDTGDLHVGHIILEVDSQSTANLSHEQVAQMMAMAYYNSPHKDHIEFVVREKSRNEFDIRRSSFMLLNNSFE